MSWRPLWDRREELPICTLVGEEGEARFYGTGRVKVVVTELPITVLLPFTVASGRFRWGVSADQRREAFMALRKIIATPGPAAVSGPGATDADQFPSLWEHLSREAYDDGTARVKSTMVIVGSAQGWQGCLSDKDNGRVLWKTSDTLLGLLLVLEEAAAKDDPADWRAATPEKFKRRK